MGRKPREDIEGAIQHVTARGNNQRDIFEDDVDRRLFLKLLISASRKAQWNFLAFCLMGNHFHLLIETPSAGMCAGMRDLLSGYARSFNRRHNRSGHLFESRYYPVRIESTEQLLAAVAYIAWNPVDAGMVDRPELWPWSSFSERNGAPPPPWLSVDRLQQLSAVNVAELVACGRLRQT